MSIINITKLNKILKNLKDKIISINKSKLENGSKIRIIIEGIFERKEKIIKPAPDWFKKWSENFENKINEEITKITKLNKDSETEVPDWFKKWSKNFENKINKRFNKIEARLDKVEKRLDKIEERLDKVEKRLDKIEGRLDKVEQDITAIKNCPTIKKELALI